MESLVQRASNHAGPEESIRLSKSAWLAGQFLGEICDYEPGTKLLQYVSFPFFNFSNFFILAVNFCELYFKFLDSQMCPLISPIVYVFNERNIALVQFSVVQWLRLKLNLPACVH